MRVRLHGYVGEPSHMEHEHNGRQEQSPELFLPIESQTKETTSSRLATLLDSQGCGRFPEVENLPRKG